MRENDIRPDRLIAEQKRLFKIDGEWLLKYKDEYVRVNCPACEMDCAIEKFYKYGQRYVECMNCKTMYINPRASLEILDRFYEQSLNYKYWSEYIYPQSEQARIENIIKPRVDRILDICNDNGARYNLFIDVGAGYGTFCQELSSRKIFKRVVAIEPTPDSAKSCKDKKIETIEKPIEKVNEINGGVDVISSFEVIEHLFSPEEYLLNCNRLLNKGGLFIVTTPNAKGFDVEILQELSDTFDMEHINLFNTHSLPLLVRKCGFEVIEIITPGKLDVELVKKNIESGKLKIKEHPSFPNIRLDNLSAIGDTLQEYIAKNKISSHMWLVAKKK